MIGITLVEKLNYIMMKQNLFIFCSVLLLISIICGCVYNKKELPKPEEQTTTVSITYTNHAKKIIDSKCTNCHSATGTQLIQSPFLTDYNLVNSQVNRIQVRALNLMNMPQSNSVNGPLTQTEKDTLQLWINQGAIE